mmetsp:Transcript_122930/g.192975  ORF Transcript_122930/g.192975 Transcript_122930/m.192975 type:complete len:285 (+) Transcript_122930:15-869(+)
MASSVQVLLGSQSRPGETCMADRKWGFDKAYAHRHLPWRWSQSAGFHAYSDDPCRLKSFRRADIPVYRQARTSSADYAERPQTKDCAVSAYGCHRQMEWACSLRTSRKPTPPRTPGREAPFVQQPSWKATDLALLELLQRKGLLIRPRPRSATATCSSRVRCTKSNCSSFGVAQALQSGEEIHIDSRRSSRPQSARQAALAPQALQLEEDFGIAAHQSSRPQSARQAALAIKEHHEASQSGEDIRIETCPQSRPQSARHTAPACQEIEMSVEERLRPLSAREKV